MPLTMDAIRQAQARIAPYALKTPLLRMECLDAALGCQVYVKAECMQRTGSFKLRGAMNRALTLTPEERARGIVAASSGNHGGRFPMRPACWAQKRRSSCRGRRPR